jgi:hypothetical protein
MDLFGLKRFKNKKYVDWCRGRNCRIHSNCNQPSVPHHQNNLLGLQGKGTKNDYLVIPMCDAAHKEYHNHPGTFWTDHCLSPWRIVIKLLITYIEEKR